ncbi:50S ribosomal protein L3 [Batrachochytrium salamandrivorans]|nr:50S ribosomal protein L3 [Batrachochytrium salamandrivorans]
MLQQGWFVRRGLAVKATNTAEVAAKAAKREFIAEQRKNWKSPYVARESRRVGVIAMKVGMTRLFDGMGDMLPVTVLKMEDVKVIQQRTEESHGYNALQLGAAPVKPKHVPMSRIGEFQKFGVELKRIVQEFRVSKDCLLESGTRIDVRHFVVGQKLDVTGTTLGKGFQGVMKRWGFAGFPESHGTSKTHRSAGAIGSCQDPGKVWPGKKMAGREGGKQRTVQNVRLVAIDPVRELLFVYGQVPGHAGNYVRVCDAIKKPNQFRDLNCNLPFPTFAGPRYEATDSGVHHWQFDAKFLLQDDAAAAKK